MTYNKTEKEIVLDPANWTLPDPKLMIAKLNKEVPSEKTYVWVLDASLSPLTLYTYLKARFGEPNGLAMQFKDDSSDNLIHYHYTLQAQDRFINVFGKNTQTDILIECAEAIVHDDWPLFVSALKNDLRNHGPRLKDVRNALEKYRLFINPYKRIRGIVDRFESRLRELNVTELVPPSNPQTLSELHSFGERFRQYLDGMIEAASLSTSLKMIAPVMAEAFINLLIFSLRKSELKNDDRLYDSILRLPIDVRTKGLSIYCEWFDRPIDPTDERFKNFHSVMNQRNDLLHANVDPQKYGLGDVFFDGNIYIGNEAQGFTDREMLHVTRYVEPASALADVAHVRAFVEFVLGHLNPGTAEGMRMLMDDDQPGWDLADKHVAVLFPDHLAEFFGFPDQEVTSHPGSGDEGATDKGRSN